jgi:hypothetical protein
LKDYADNVDTLNFLLKIWWYLIIGIVFDKL